MKKILAIAVATAISAPAMADLTIGGSARYDVSDSDGTTATAGRVQLAVSGSAEGANGAYASYGAAINLNMGGLDELTATTGTNYSPENVSFDDVTLTIGNEMAKVQFGEFEMQKAFNNGADTFAPTVTVVGYENSDVRGRDSGNVQVTFNVADLAVTAGTRIQDADADSQIGVAGTFGGVSVAAVFDQNNDGADNGIALTAGTTVEGVALNASYADRGAAESVNVNASYNGFGIAFETTNDGSTEEDTTYGTYTLADVAGIAGASVIVGGGSSDTADKFGVRLNYAF